MADIKPKQIGYKYDLMHLNTPSYASCEVTWDTSKLTPITFNRVVKALQTGVIQFSRGDAANLYQELRKRFEIPEFILRKPQLKGKNTRSGYVHWEFATDKLMLALEPIYKAEQVLARMESSYVPWYLQKDKLSNEDYFYFDNNHDMTEVEAAINEIVNSPEIKDKREQAIHFVETGGKLTFTWRE